jgi:hypothetical protein
MNGFRNGTCYTSEECTEKGGTASGSCASGFGTCCVFAFAECGKEVNQNCTYVRNEGYPSAVTTSGSCQYKVKKCADNICTLRLDFDTFVILAGTGTSTIVAGAPPYREDNTFDCQDTFTVTGLSNAQNIPTICGTNSGEHIYVELGMGASNTATLDFSFGSAAGNRMFEVKVSQFTCDSPVRPPEGCLQYYMGTEGRIRSFNFAAETHHLNNQQYSICMRQEMGFCCNQYSVCALTNSFTLDDQTVKAKHDADCSDDYIEIEASSNVCGGRLFHNRYCGDLLSAFTDSDMGNAIVCDCTAPFRVNVHTNAGTDAAGAPLQDTMMIANRGLCLDYVQQACNGL